MKRPMEFSIKLHTIKPGWSIVYLLRSQPIVYVFLLKLFFLVNSAYTDEMPRNATFHLVLHCLSKYHDVHKGLAVDKLGCFCVLFL